ncbi:MAG: thioredoxin family protein [Colwellia sp.]|nr:thioredoxin family protein [Colwellia sp.]
MKVVVVLVISVLSLYLFATDNAQAKSSNIQQKKELSLIHNLPDYSKVYDEQRDPFNDANAALTLAKKTNRHVLIEIGGNWCTWCHKMDAFLLKNPNIYQALHNKYVLLKINVSDANENEAFMKSLPPVLGYPHMYISSATGKMLLSKDTAELQDNNGYSKDYWLSFLNKWQSKQPSS